MKKKLFENRVYVDGEIKFVLTSDQARHAISVFLLENLAWGYHDNCLNDGIPLMLPHFVGNKPIGELTDAELVSALEELPLANDIIKELSGELPVGVQVSLFVGESKVTEY